MMPPHPRPDAPVVVTGDFFYRTNDGSVGRTEVLLEIASDRVLVRYSDDIEHVGRRGDDVVGFFATGLVPSLARTAAARASGPEGFLK